MSVTRATVILNAKFMNALTIFVGKVENRRSQGDIFNPKMPADGVKKKHMKRLKAHFECIHGLQHSNILKVWHGCSEAAAHAISDAGPTDLRKTMAGTLARAFT